MSLTSNIEKNKNLYLIILAGIILFVFAGSLIKLIRAILDPNSGANQTSNFDQNSLDNLTVNTAGLSMPEITADTLADTLFQILNVDVWTPAQSWNPIYTSSRAELFNALSVIQNKDDADYIIKKFGTKAPSFHVLYLFTPTIGDAMTLPTWLAYQLNSDDLPKAQKMLFLI